MNRTVIIHLCILMSLLLVVRCDDDNDDDYVAEDEDDASANSNFANYQDYESPTKSYATDPKIVSRNVKCLGKRPFTFCTKTFPLKVLFPLFV